MWFKVEQKRTSIGQKYVVRCRGEIAGASIDEERPAKGIAEAKKTAELLASTLNVTATVHGTDADGEFVHGVDEVGAGADDANSPLIKRLYAESAAASLTIKDRLLADIPVEAIKGFATLSAALGYIVAEHKQIKRAATPQINYATLFRIFCNGREPTILTLSADDGTIATGELLQVLSGGSAYDDIITIATTNHPEAIDDALSKRAGRFDAQAIRAKPTDSAS